ncbi:MAG: family 43 glycosylhydrolase [Sphaerochaeta sp.]|jgi:xylan 1,4-beta-xylosidase|nr:family 43 glycosylhydrolase [Sphaerochaeta sp.]
MIHNPILRGFCPDPSMIRVGDDVYIATSTFEWWPGVKLWHSRDLEHWEQLPSPLDRQSQLMMEGIPNNCGIWAPDLSYAHGMFYLVYTNMHTQKMPYYTSPNYLVTAPSIEGPWSDPIFLNSTGFDPSLFHDTDGKQYLVNMHNGFTGIFLQEFDQAHGCLVGDQVKLIDSDRTMLSEGPHLYREGDWYYLIVAEGGTGYEHRVTQLRSKTLRGPWERNPKPLITSHLDRGLQKCGHGSIMKYRDGEYYLACLCARPVPGAHRCPLGRETALFPLHMQDEWFVLSNGTGFPDEAYEDPLQVEEKTYMFDQPELPKEFISLRRPLGEDLQIENGNLALYGEEPFTSGFRVSLIAVPSKAFRFRATTEIHYTPICQEQAAGILYLYNNENCIALLVTKDTVVCQRFEHGAYKEYRFPMSLGPVVTLSLSVDRFNVICSINENPLPLVLDASHLCDEGAPGFTGSHVALYTHDMTGARLPCLFRLLRFGRL